MPDYPQCEKWSNALHEHGRSIIDFLEWLELEEIVLCKIDDSDYYPINETWLNLLYRYFNINPRELEAEGQSMITELQSKGGE